MYIYIYIYICVCVCRLMQEGRGSSALAVELRLFCTNSWICISVYRTLCLCEKDMDLLLTYWSSVFLALAHWCDLIQERKMVIQPATLPFCHRVCVTHSSGVKNIHQCPVCECGVSTRANTCLHGKPTAQY